ncbi:hypothetical protein JW805_03110 [Roseomonas aeriglobus]|nr:hypothetical protein [Roseomonas aeriglobus]
MTRITITENGCETIVTDIAPYRAELTATVAKLKPIYARFESGTVSALDGREDEIVRHINRVEELEYMIASFEQACIRRANILAGWEIVKRYHAEGEA